MKLSGSLKNPWTLGGLAAVVGITQFFFGDAGTIKEYLFDSPEMVSLQGTVWDKNSDKPIKGVSVILADQKETVVTDQAGVFQFKSKGPKGKQVVIQTRKEGYKNKSTQVSFGHPSFILKLETETE